MSVPINALRRGRIVWATVRDPKGYRKRRPGIILTPDDEISENKPIVLMAITTSFPSPSPLDHVELPWNSDPRRVETRLGRRSAAVINWLDTVYLDEIDSVIGIVPPPKMREIERRMKSI